MLLSVSVKSSVVVTGYNHNATTQSKDIEMAVYFVLLAKKII